MPREKDFNQSTVIKKCTFLFANNGYSATGIQEIVESTGINRSSLYSTFKGKDELFLTCLDVASKEEISALNEMNKKFTGLKFVDSYLVSAIKSQTQSHLFKFASAEFKLLNKKTQSFVNAHYRWRYHFLLSIVQEGQKTEKISKKLEAKDIVVMLELITQGIQNLSSLADAEKLYKKSVLRFSSLIKKKK